MSMNPTHSGPLPVGHGETTPFGYDAAVLQRYPTIRAGVVRATGLSNGPSGPELRDEYGAVQRAAADRLRGTAVAELPSIAAWRRAFTAFGVKPTQYRNAAEALLRRLTKHGDLPCINTLVDIGNLVSIRHAMPVAVLDLASIADPITVRFATGTEAFVDLGATGAVHPEPGEVIFVDRDDVVSCRRRRRGERAARQSRRPGPRSWLSRCSAACSVAGTPEGHAPGITGSHTRMVDGPRVPQSWYGISATSTGVAVSPAGGTSPGTPYGHARSAGDARAPRTITRPSRRSGATAGSTTNAPRSPPSGRSADSRHSTNGPRSTATVPRTASMRGSGAVQRASTGSSSRTTSPTSNRRCTSATPAGTVRARPSGSVSTASRAHDGTRSESVHGVGGVSVMRTVTVPSSG